MISFIVIKNILKELLILFHLDFTQNLRYDRLTRVILKKVLTRNFNCIDVGCHKGEILDLILKYAPDGKHYAFEPIPYLFQSLKIKYFDKATLYPFALSDSSGKTTFHLVKNAPAYSGIKIRKYDIENPDIEKINVTKERLDAVVPENQKIDLIKIDVEGGEFAVLKGAIHLLKNHKPIILFEFGKGASDFYGTTPSDMFEFLSLEFKYKIYTLEYFLNKQEPTKKDEFINYFENGTEYYFIAI
nr:FkbM family methyltransferase [uncultured Pedobacter sp.]